MRHDIEIRIAGAADPAVAHLTALDSAEPLGRALVAEVGGRPVAAVAYDGTRAVSDPFEPTPHEAIALLVERSAQLRGQRVAGELRRWRRGERSERRRPARAQRPSPVLRRRAPSLPTAAVQGR